MHPIGTEKVTKTIQKLTNGKAATIKFSQNSWNRV